MPKVQCEICGKTIDTRGRHMHIRTHGDTMQKGGKPPHTLDPQTRKHAEQLKDKIENRLEQLNALYCSSCNQSIQKNSLETNYAFGLKNSQNIFCIKCFLASAEHTAAFTKIKLLE